MAKSIPNSWESIPGPDDITRYQLENGIILLCRDNYASPSVVINGYLGCGSMFDPDDRLGLSLFTSQALMRGTKYRSQHDIFDALESAGASLGFSTGVHSSTFGGRSLAEDLPLLLGMLSECLRFPDFPATQLELLRSQMLTSLAIRAQDTEQQASLAFEEILFSGHPYGRPEDGYEHTVSAISRNDVHAFHQAYYGPRGMVIAVVGAVSPEQVLSEVNKNFQDWSSEHQQAGKDFPALARVGRNIRRHVSLEDKSQTDLVVGTLGPSRLSPDFLPASLGNRILGQFGMMGRIGESVRERAGLAYYAGSNLNTGPEGGSWEVNAGVSPENLNKTIALIEEELKRFLEEPVTDEEISDSVSNLIGMLPLSLESNGGVAGALVRLERFKLGLDYFHRYPALLKAITPEIILSMAQKYFDLDRLVITSAGPGSAE